MPIKHAIWKVGSQPSLLPTTMLLSEKKLENMIVTAPQILFCDWMLIGRQKQTGLGGRIDLLAIAPDEESRQRSGALRQSKTPFASQALQSGDMPWNG